jgi:hypothetical protein
VLLVRNVETLARRSERSHDVVERGEQGGAIYLLDHRGEASKRDRFGLCSIDSSFFLSWFVFYTTPYIVSGAALQTAWANREPRPTGAAARTLIAPGYGRS